MSSLKKSKWVDLEPEPPKGMAVSATRAVSGVSCKDARCDTTCVVTKGAEVVQNARLALLILHRVFHIHLSHLNIDKKDMADLPMI